MKENDNDNMSRPKEHIIVDTQCERKLSEERVCVTGEDFQSKEDRCKNNSLSFYR